MVPQVRVRSLDANLGLRADTPVRQSRSDVRSPSSERPESLGCDRANTCTFSATISTHVHQSDDHQSPRSLQ
jgi:hypothetical protein